MVQAGTGRMRLTEQELRCVTLAQAVERADTAHALVSAVELDDATRQAALQARQGGVQRVGVADVVLGRAQAIVERARARDTTIAALCIPRWHAAMRALPAVALLMGLAADRIANAHRVDLLSPPLLAVVAWNLAVYVLMLWRALRRPADAEHAVSVLWALQGFLLRWQAGLGRTARRALAGRIVAEFETLWLQRSHALLALRTAHVLHLCAAAWAAGIALSLLLRGLVVNYRFGWESTFLDAAQVHAIVSVLFWPMTAVFGLAPLALQDIVATQDFAGEGVAGSRWVWMYVGLLLLVVILPRLCLAVWAQWHALRQVRQCALDTGETSFDTLRTALPADLELGLVGASAVQVGVLCDTPGGLHSAQGDRLRFVLPCDSAVSSAVDAVLVCDPALAAAVPVAWQAAPMHVLPWAEWGESWVQEGALFECLETLWPAHHAALLRLREARVADHEARFAQALQILARHLRASAALDPVQDDANGPHVRLLRALEADLRTLYGGVLPSQESHGQTMALVPRRGTDGVALAVGTSAGAAAGAAAGAKVGALIDVGTGGLTLGAGTALGALLGGATAWVMRSAQKKDAAQEWLWWKVEQACTHYLVVAHDARVSSPHAVSLAERWRAEVTATVAAHGPALAQALQAPPAPQDALVPLLGGMLRGILQRSLAPSAPRVDR
jgi:hypothetical protein